MYFYIKKITKLKKGEVLPPFSKTPPENSFKLYELRMTKKL